LNFFLLAAGVQGDGHRPPISVARKDLEEAHSRLLETRISNEIEANPGSLDFAPGGTWISKETLDQVLIRLGQGKPPKYALDDYLKADKELNEVYAEVMAGDFPEASSLKKEGIRGAQRAWIQFRDAWAKFGPLWSPGTSEDGWKTYATLERSAQLRDFLGKEDTLPFEYRCETTSPTATQLTPLSSNAKEFPELFFWNRQYKREGKSQPSRKMLKKGGAVVPAANPDSSPPKKTRYWRLNDQSQDWGTRMFSPNPGWKFKLESVNEVGNTEVACWSSSRLVVRGPHQKKYYYLPDFGATSSAALEFFDSERNTLYVSLVNGTSTVRNEPLLLFDLKEEKFYLVGETAGFAVSPDRQWIVWGSGEKYGDLGNMTVHVQTLNLFEIGKRTNFQVSSGVCLDIFEAFAGEPR
jgi:hypothetical protein